MSNTPQPSEGGWHTSLEPAAAQVSSCPRRDLGEAPCQARVLAPTPDSLFGPGATQADDRTFYQAASLLQRAEAAPNSGEAAQLAQRALQLMGRAPAAVDLQVVLPQLALLGAWDGVVSLPLQARHSRRCLPSPTFLPYCACARVHVCAATCDLGELASCERTGWPGCLSGQCTGASAKCTALDL